MLFWGTEVRERKTFEIRSFSSLDLADDVLAWRVSHQKAWGLSVTCWRICETGSCDLLIRTNGAT